MSFSTPCKFDKNEIVVIEHPGGDGGCHIRVKPGSMREADPDGGYGSFAQWQVHPQDGGSKVRFKSMKGNYWLRIADGDKVNVLGSGGGLTIFKVHRDGKFIKLESNYYADKYIAVGKNNVVRVGTGGAWCKLKIFTKTAINNQTEGCDEKKHEIDANQIETTDYSLSIKQSTTSLIICSQNTKLAMITYELKIDENNLKDCCQGLCDNLIEFASFIMKSKPYSKDNNKNENCTVYKIISNANNQQTIEFHTGWGKKLKLILFQTKIFDINSMMKIMQQIQPKRVSFNGRQNAMNQNNECQIFNSFGISKVIRKSKGQYEIFFDQPLNNNNYTVSLSQNMLMTNGVIIGLEGNNRTGDTYCTQTKTSFKIGTRCPRQNANSDCDLIHVVVYQ